LFFRTVGAETGFAQGSSQSMQWRSKTSTARGHGVTLARLLLMARSRCDGRVLELHRMVQQGRGAAPDEPPEKLYNEGVFLLDRKGDYKDAAKKFSEVERQHPYRTGPQGLLMSAYANYEPRNTPSRCRAARAM